MKKMTSPNNLPHIYTLGRETLLRNDCHLGSDDTSQPLCLCVLVSSATLPTAASVLVQLGRAHSVIIAAASIMTACEVPPGDVTSRQCNLTARPPASEVKRGYCMIVRGVTSEQVDRNPSLRWSTLRVELQVCDVDIGVCHLNQTKTSRNTHNERHM